VSCGEVGVERQLVDYEAMRVTMCEKHYAGKKSGLTHSQTMWQSLSPSTTENK